MIANTVFVDNTMIGKKDKKVVVEAVLNTVHNCYMRVGGTVVDNMVAMEAVQLCCIHFHTCRCFHIYPYFRTYDIFAILRI